MVYASLDILINLIISILFIYSLLTSPVFSFNLALLSLLPALYVYLFVVVTCHLTATVSGLWPVIAPSNK